MMVDTLVHGTYARPGATKVSDDGPDGELVSVLIPTYYRNDLLRRAIESVIDQEYDPVETIVVDDSGEGHAADVVSEYDDVDYIEHSENRGLEHARRTGIRAASGEFIQFLDDDDRLLPGKFTEQVELFTDDVGVVYSGYVSHPSGEVKRPNPKRRGDVLEAALGIMPMANTVTILTRSDCLEHLLPLELRGLDITAIVIELARRTRFEFVDEPLARVREIEGTMSSPSRSIEIRRELLAMYSDLYDQYPHARRKLLNDIFQMRASEALRDRYWSWEAIRSNAKAAYYAPSSKARLLRSYFCLASVFGRPGIRVATALWKGVRS
jgi:glycosyltransferase involved in cell wall biosynthesis